MPSQSDLERAPCRRSGRLQAKAGPKSGGQERCSGKGHPGRRGRYGRSDDPTDVRRGQGGVLLAGQRLQIGVGQLEGRLFTHDRFEASARGRLVAAILGVECPGVTLGQGARELGRTA